MTPLQTGRKGLSALRSLARTITRGSAGLEQALSANWSADATSGVTVDASDLLSDIHGNAEYRANLVKVMAKRAVAAA